MFRKVRPKARGGNLNEPRVAQRDITDPTPECNVINKARRSLCANRKEGAEDLLNTEPNKIASRSGNQREQSMDDRRVIGQDQAPAFIGDRECDRTGWPTSVDPLATDREYTVREEFAHATRCIVRRLHVDGARCGQVSTLDRLNLRTLISGRLARWSCCGCVAPTLPCGAVPFADRIEVETELQVTPSRSRRCVGHCSGRLLHAAKCRTRR